MISLDFGEILFHSFSLTTEFPPSVSELPSPPSNTAPPTLIASRSQLSKRCSAPSTGYSVPRCTPPSTLKDAGFGSARPDFSCTSPFRCSFPPSSSDISIQSTTSP